MPHAIINTIHAIINKIYTIIIYPMLLLTIWCYYQPTHASISKTHSIIRHLIFRHLNNTYYYQTHHLIIRHLCYYQPNHIIIRYYQTPHIILKTSTYYSYTWYDTIIPLCRALAHCGATGRVHALGPWFKSRSGKNFFGLFEVFNDGDLECDNRFMAAHIALREKVVLGKSLYLHLKLYFLK